MAGFGGTAVEREAHGGLTNGSGRSDTGDQWTEVSLKGLAELVKRFHDGSATAGECELFAFLSRDVLDGPLMASGQWSVSLERVLRDFFQSGDAKAAGAKHGVGAKTAQRWVGRFVDLASRVLQRKKAIEAAEVACSLICERKAQHSPSFGPDPWHSRSVTRQADVMDGGMCSGCPRRQV